MEIKCLIEREPMGTAGPIWMAAEHLLDKNSEIFFVLNSDIVCHYEFSKMLEKHRSHSGMATMCVKDVEDPSKFGVVVADDNGQVQEYKQNPKSFLSTKVNAGVYLFSTSLINSGKIKSIPSSLEKDILPMLAKEGNLFCVSLDRFWMDIGDPHNYLLGT